MEIKQSFSVQHSPEIVWDALADAPFAVRCLPGAELDESSDGRNYKGRMRVKLGPLSAAFSGDAVVERDVANKVGTVEWTGVDSRSNSRAKARMTYMVLSENEGRAASVQVNADIALTGALAQFGRSSIVNDVATHLTAVFAENLQNSLNASAEDKSMVQESGTAAKTRPAQPFKGAELRPMQLIMSVIRSRIATRLRRWADWFDPLSRRA